jgi:hypothetical protein
MRASRRAGPQGTPTGRSLSVVDPLERTQAYDTMNLTVPGRAMYCRMHGGAPYRMVRGGARCHTVHGGEGGIRTHGPIARPHAFQACSFSHSDTSPWPRAAGAQPDRTRCPAFETRGNPISIASEVEPGQTANDCGFFCPHPLPPVRPGPVSKRRSLPPFVAGVKRPSPHGRNATLAVFIAAAESTAPWPLRFRLRRSLLL